MSHYRVKTKYQVEGPYGSREERTLYVHINNGCDVTSFYDHDGTFLFAVEDTVDNNLMDAIERTFAPFKNGGISLELNDGVEFMTPDEFKFINQ